MYVVRRGPYPTAAYNRHPDQGHNHATAPQGTLRGIERRAPVEECYNAYEGAVLVWTPFCYVMVAESEMVLH